MQPLITLVRTINIALVLAIVYFCGSVIIMPYEDRIAYAWEQRTQTEEDQYLYATDLAAETEGLDITKLKIKPEANTLVMPKLGVDGEVYQGGEENLNLGYWHIPGTSTPDQGGNTVIVAHRFLYTDGPNTFYHLDKAEVGDKFTLFWEQVEYTYEVKEVFEVTPDQVEIEEQTEEEMLTLYTCTPIFSAAKRLVVRAVPIKSTPYEPGAVR